LAGHPRQTRVTLNVLHCRAHNFAIRVGQRRGDIGGAIF
jgi:hypothetical protein